VIYDSLKPVKNSIEQKYDSQKKKTFPPSIVKKNIFKSVKYVKNARGKMTNAKNAAALFVLHTFIAV